MNITSHHRSIHEAAGALHKELLGQLERLLLQEAANEEVEARKLNSAIILCEDYIKQVDHLAPRNGFENNKEEIQYFKYLKPLFTSEREYYLLRYHANIFGSGNENFWLPELTRINRALADTKEFTDYYEGGHTHNDTTWFSHGQIPSPCVLCLQGVDVATRHNSARDKWVAGLIAVQRYKEWLVKTIGEQEKIK